MSTNRKNFAAFFSYLQIIDKQDRGRLSKLREDLEREVEIQRGEPFTIFQDREDLHWGEAWKKRINGAIDNCTYLIAIISPGYFSSKPCRDEFEFFLQREKKLGATELILPLIYIDTPVLKDNDGLDPIIDEIKKRQWVDWTDLRHKPWGSPEITERLASLGKQIRDLINTNSVMVSASPVKKDTLQSIVKELPEISFPTITPTSTIEPVDESQPLYLLTVFLRPTANSERDRRRIKNIYGVLISHPGKDRFQFQIFENGLGHLIDFPNDTTRIDPEMLDRLKKLMGGEEWRIEEIVY
jgi:hypothetical protein